MKRNVLLFFLIMLCVSCTIEPTRTVKVSIEEDHPWETVVGKPLWYTITWNDGKGIASRHLPPGVRSTIIRVPVGRTTVICAYPLGTMQPFGGATTGEKNHVVLAQRAGELTSLLLDLHVSMPESICEVQVPTLLDAITGKCEGNARLFDHARLAKAVVEGKLTASSVHKISPVTVTLSDLPTGRWVGETKQSDFFWKDYVQPVTLVLEPGIHRYINLEYALELRVFIDEADQRTFFTVRQAPPWSQ